MSGVSRCETRGEFAAGRRGRREHRELRRAPVHLVRVVADDRDPRAGLRQASRRVRRLAEDRADDQKRRTARAFRRRGRSAGRGRRRADGPAGSRHVLRTTPGRRAHRAARRADQRRPALGAVGAGADHKRRASARKATSSSTAAGSARAARRTCTGAACSRSSSAAASQSSIGTITIAGPRWVSASCERGGSRRGRPRRTGWSTQTGPARPAASCQERPEGRCRRSCWPTSTTSGPDSRGLSRERRRRSRALRSCGGGRRRAAPARAPSPWRGRQRAPSCSASTKRRSSGKSARNGTRSSRGSRRPSSARARGGRRTSRPVPSSRVGQYLARRMFGMRTSVHMLDQGAACNPDYVQSLERGLAVIRAFGADTPDLRLSDVARHGSHEGRGPALPADARAARVRAAGRRELLAPPAGARARLRLPLRAQPAGGRAAAHGDPGRRSERIVVGRRARRRGHRLCRPGPDAADHDDHDRGRDEAAGLRDVDGPRAARRLEPDATRSGSSGSSSSA